MNVPPGTSGPLEKKTETQNSNNKKLVPNSSPLAPRGRAFSPSWNRQEPRFPRGRGQRLVSTVDLHPQTPGCLLLWLPADQGGWNVPTSPSDLPPSRRVVLTREQPLSASRGKHRSKKWREVRGGHVLPYRLVFPQRALDNGVLENTSI